MVSLVAILAAVIYGKLAYRKWKQSLESRMLGLNAAMNRYDALSDHMLKESSSQFGPLRDSLFRSVN